MSASNLDTEILAAHELGDSYKLAELYAKAADMKAGEGLADAAGFLRTHAYVFALESAHPLASCLRAQLAAEGRELSE